MKAYLSVCGMGVGHVIRCESIAKALIARGVNIVYSTYSDGERYVISKKLPRIDTVPLSLCMDEDGAVDFKKTAATHPGFFRGIWLLAKQVVAEIRNIQACKPDIVISDSRVSSVLASKILRIPTVVILNQYSIFLSKRSHKNNESVMDRIFFLVANVVWAFVRIIIAEFWSFADQIVIPDLPPPNTLSIHNLHFPKRHRRKISFVGPIVDTSCRRREDKAIVRQRLGLNQDMPLIFVPVSMPQSVRESFIRTFEGVLHEMRNYQIVLSRCLVGGSTTATRQGNLVAYDWIENPSEFFSACDIVVCRAGHGTIIHSILFGKPMIIIPMPNHPEQMRNAKRACDLGDAIILPQSELTSQKLDCAVGEMLSDQSRILRASRIRELACSLDGVNATLSVINNLTKNRIS